MNQSECKEMFVNHMKKSVRFYDRIDKETPVSSPGNLTEPKWWLDMMELQRQMNSLIKKHNG